MSGGTPAEPSYGDQMASTLLAQEQAATGTGAFSSMGPLLNLEENPTTGVPGWTGLSMDTLSQILNGTPETAPTGATTTPGGWYNSQGLEVSQNPDFQGFAIPGTSGGAGNLPAQYTTKNLVWEPGITTPGSSGAAVPGLLSLEGQSSQAQATQSAQANTISRAANINDLMTLGPQYTAGMTAANPGTTNLLNEMTTQAGDELAMGSNLTPAQTRTATQGVRAQNQGMLGGTGNAGDYAAALGLSSYGQQLQSNRQNYASNVLTARNNYYGNAYTNLIGGTTSTNPNAYISQASGISASSTNPYNPNSQLASNIQNQNSQIASANSAANASTTNSLIGAGASAAGLLALAFL